MSEWKDISHELYRSYVVEFDQYSGIPRFVKFDSPQKLKIRDSGAHMIVDKNGATHYINKWYTICWMHRDSDKGTYNEF